MVTVSRSLTSNLLRFAGLPSQAFMLVFAIGFVNLEGRFR